VRSNASLKTLEIAPSRWIAKMITPSAYCKPTAVLGKLASHLQILTGFLQSFANLDLGPHFIYSVTHWDKY